MSRPSVTIIIPVLDEAAHIESALRDLLGQNYGGTVEIVIADGGSTDGTREWLDDLARREPRVRVIDNPNRRQAPGLNAAAAVAKGELLIRADAHSRYAHDYVDRSVQALQELEGAVGGRMNPVGYDRRSNAVAAAMNSPLTMGPARFHHAVEREPVDTVYLGAFSKADFHELGGIRSLPSGSSEDADFYFRWRLSGRKVWVDPSIVSWYTPRNTLGALWRQYWRYGQGKSEMLWVNGRFPSWRPFVPILAVAGLAVLTGLALLTGVWWPLLTLGGAWLVVLLSAAIPSPASTLDVLVTAGVMHVAYGLGGLWGLLKGPRSLRDLK